MLEQLSRFSVIVADTGELEAIRKYRPTDATTNPSLLLAAAQLPEYQHLVQDAIDFGTSSDAPSTEERLALIMDRLAVNFGKEILSIVPGYVSTEVDARLRWGVPAPPLPSRQLSAWACAALTRRPRWRALGASLPCTRRPASARTACSSRCAPAPFPALHLCA